jgi:proline iminopeptidase
MEREGFVPVTGGRVWYHVVGDGDGVPLLTLHGGPGFSHDYLEPLGALGAERPVVFYDQLGCGRSDRPGDPALWRVERFVEEVDAVRLALGLERLHLLGQSWGTMLGVDYLLAHGDGVMGVVLASPAISIPRWCADAAELRAALPEAVQAVLDSHEAAGSTRCPEYQAAMLVFYKRHVCRLDPWPDCLERAYAGEGEDVYETMWGPSEFHVTGTLRDYDRTGRLKEITNRTLVTCGAHDEATPGASALYANELPRGRLVVFDESAHLPHVEEAERYNAVVSEFLAEVEAGD